jgi:hypothetical protein
MYIGCFSECSPRSVSCSRVCVQIITIKLTVTCKVERLAVRTQFVVSGCSESDPCGAEAEL